MSMNKIKNDKGEVAVIHTTTYCGGWYSSLRSEAILFCPEIVELVLQGNNHLIDKKLIDNLFTKDVRWCKLENSAPYLTVTWVPEGVPFKIEEEDGKEWIVYLKPDEWIIA